MMDESPPSSPTTVLQPSISELQELDEEYRQIEDLHRKYTLKVEEMQDLQQQCTKAIAHQRYRTNQILLSMGKLKGYLGNEDKQVVADIDSRINKRKALCRELEDVLPHANTTYLRIILGQAPVSIIGKAEKFKYKAEYEKFKLILSMIIMVFCVIVFVLQWRVTDALLHFLMVWYYCTLTIRESILIVNGSRIKGWWVAHHFISTVCAGVFVTWPEGATYQSFRAQLSFFVFYISAVQVLQYYYQSGCLYRLRALGERHNMDITVEGFQSWMWRGLTFLIPFLLLGYAFQLYNSYTLFQLSYHEECQEWQVVVLSLIFFILFFGNTMTILLVIQKKIRSKSVQQRWQWAGSMLRSKYNKIMYESNSYGGTVKTE